MYNLFEWFFDNDLGMIRIYHSYKVVVNGIEMVNLDRQNGVGL